MIVECIGPHHMDTHAQDARKAERWLAGHLSGGGYVEAVSVDGVWHLLTTGTGDGTFLYTVSDVLLSIDADCSIAECEANDYTAEEWDYTQWCQHVDAVTDRDIAVAVYRETGHMACRPGACEQIVDPSTL